MPRLLVLEDDEDSRAILEFLLTSAGCEVVTASRAIDAIRVLEREAFDFVLADLLLDGESLEDSWRAIERFVALARPAPVGMISGWPVPPEEGRRHGLAFVLAKPCTRAKVLGQLATSLELPPPPPEQQALLRAYFASLEAGDYPALGALCTDDVVYQLPGSDPRFAREIAGRDAFIEFSAQTFREFREPRFEISAIRPLPAGVMVDYVGSWRTDDGVRELPGTVMFVFRGERIAQIGVRIDPERVA